MDKITVKNIPIGIKIKVTKKRLLSIPKIMYTKVKEFYHKQKDKIKNYVTEAEKNVALKEELNKFDNKRKELSQAKKEVKKSDEFTVDTKKYYLEAIEEEIERIKNKRKKRKNKGLGIFSIGKLYVSKYISNQKEKANKRKAKRELEKALKEQLKIEKEEQELREKLEKLSTEKASLVEKREESIKNNPKLEEYYKSISSEEKGKTDEKKIIPITAARKATEEEKTEIKNSSKFKKAVAALSAIVVATGVVLGAMNVGNVNSTLDKPIVHSQEEVQQKENKIVLNDYVNLENGSKIFDSPTFAGRSGEIGTNGYDGNTLFKVNAVSYTDKNNIVTTFNLVGQNEETKKNIEASHDEYMKNNPNSVVSAFHVIPYSDTETAELGGWTNTSSAKINKVDINNINQQNLGGMVK